ncbi:MAG: hypothetical protein AAGB05_02180 [Pseudomonadota bacterium]
MIILAAVLLGAGVGTWRARARGGNGADMAQYGIAHAIAFGLLGLFVTIGLEYNL